MIKKEEKTFSFYATRIRAAHTTSPGKGKRTSPLMLWSPRLYHGSNVYGPRYPTVCVVPSQRMCGAHTITPRKGSQPAPKVKPLSSALNVATPKRVKEILKRSKCTAEQKAQLIKDHRKAQLELSTYNKHAVTFKRPRLLCKLARAIQDGIRHKLHSAIDTIKHHSEDKRPDESVGNTGGTEPSVVGRVIQAAVDCVRAGARWTSETVCELGHKVVALFGRLWAIIKRVQECNLEFVDWVVGDPRTAKMVLRLASELSARLKKCANAAAAAEVVDKLSKYVNKHANQVCATLFSVASGNVAGVVITGFSSILFEVVKQAVLSSAESEVAGLTPVTGISKSGPSHGLPKAVRKEVLKQKKLVSSRASYRLPSRLSSVHTVLPSFYYTSYLYKL